MPRQATRKFYTGISNSRMSYWEILKYLGLTTNIGFCYDAGAHQGVSPGQDVGSAGTGSNPIALLDLSGQGRHAFLGSTSAATTTDAAFFGTVGRGSANEYFSANQNNTTRMLSLATATYGSTFHFNANDFSFVGVVDPRSQTTLNMRIAGNSSGTGINVLNGFEFYVTNAGALTLSVDVLTGGANSVVCTPGVTLAHRQNGPFPTFVACSKSSTTAIVRYGQWSGSTALAAATNVTASTKTMKFGAEGDASPGMDRRQKIYMLASWTRALTDAEMASIRDMIRQHRIQDCL